MSKKPDLQQMLRMEAEAKLAQTTPNDAAPGASETLLHELHVHQIELEMQNEELRRSHIVLEEAHARYVDLYEFSPVGYLTLSREGLIDAINLTGSALLGKERKKLLQRRFAGFVAPHDQDSWRQYFMRMMQARTTDICELTLLRGDGTVFNARLDCLLTVDDVAAPALRVTITDITERKRLDRLLQYQNAELELAKAAAEKSNLAKSDFLSRMSHDLRTPLNAILGFAQLLEAGVPPPTEVQALRLQHIIKAGWYLLDMINDILNISVIEAGKLTLSRESVLLADVMRECQAMMEPLAHKRGIPINFLPYDPSWCVYADLTRVKQVLLNLFSNAIKYNRKHGTVEVKCSAGADRIRISIKDNGAGLPPEKIAQLFQPFNRLGQEKSAAEGTGIGLVVAKQLVELMGGTIGVDSTVGVGSEFWIELLRDVVPKTTAASDMTAQFVLPTLASRSSDVAQRRVLYVEDNPDNLMLMEQIMEEGYPQVRLLSAADGNLGVALARAHLPDVILMDIDLPGISGIEALKILRQDMATMHIPVIAISANAMLHDIESGLVAGFLRYLTKPVKIAEFQDAMNVALKFSGREKELVK